MTQAVITDGSITIPNPVRQHDAFTATFTFHADNIWFEGFTYQIVGLDTTSGSYTIMAQAHEDNLIPSTFPGGTVTRHISCNGDYTTSCGFYMDPSPPVGGVVEIFAKVIPDSNPDLGNWMYELCLPSDPYCNTPFTYASDQGTPQVSVANLPTKVTPSQQVTLHFTVVASGNVDYPEFALVQTAGPTVKVQLGNGTWQSLSSTPYYWGPIANRLAAGSGIDELILLQMPDAGIFDSNTGQVVTIGVIPARQATDFVTNIAYEPIVYTSTFVQKATTTCTQDATRCVDSNGVLNAGCIKQVCNNNVWTQVSANDPTCTGCGVTNHTCTSKLGTQVPAGTTECGHPNACSRYTCNGVTSAWDLTTTTDTTCGTGTQCATPVCTSGQTSCDSTITHGSACTKYDCVSGQWVKDLNPGMFDCGTSCAVKSPIVIGGIALGVVGLAAVVYLVSTSKPSARPPQNRRRR